MTSSAPATAPRWRGAILVGGVVILAVIVTLLAVNVLGRQPGTAGPSVPPSEAPSEAPSEEPIGSPGSPDPSEEPAPSEDPTPTPIAAPGEWTLVHTFGLDGTRWVGGEIAHGKAGFLAIGRRWEGGHGGPRITEYGMWLSADGRQWTEVQYPLADWGDYHAVALTGAADGSYVFHALGEPGADYQRPTVSLRSTDGQTWEPIQTGLPDEIAIGSIERGPSGYLLVADQARNVNPSLWLSADGLTWELVHEFTQDEHFVQIHDGDAGAEGYVVIGRRIVPGGVSYERFSFASADGRNWVERAAPFGQDPQDFVGDVSVSSLGPDWVATLARRDDTTSTWTSADGLTWTESGSIPLRNENVADAGFLGEVGGEVIASPGGGTYFDGTPGIFTTTDGATWSTVDVDAEVWLGEMAIGDGLVAVTGTIEVDDGTMRGAIWIRAAG